MTTIRLLPAGTTIEVAPGTPLQDVLFPHGVEFPCGGRGTCKACRVRVRGVAPPPGDDDRKAFASGLLDAGWRLGCRMRADADLELELGVWSSPVLADDSAVTIEAQPGCGIAIDLGTTTLAAQLVDRADGRVLATRTALNPQARHGADLMTRIDVALRGGAQQLAGLVRVELGRLVAELACSAAST